MTPTWMNTSALISPTCIAAADGTAWITDGPTLYKYNGMTWTMMSKPGSVSITSLSAAAYDGSVLAVDSAGTHLYTTAAGTWSSMYISAYGTTSPAIGDANHMAIVDSTTAITKSVMGINTALATGPAKITTTYALNNLWGITAAGAVYQYSPTLAAWSAVTGKTLTQIHASLSSTGTLQIVGVDTLGKGWSYNGTSWTSIITPNVGDKFSIIQAGAGHIWAVMATTGAVYTGTI